MSNWVWLLAKVLLFIFSMFVGKVGVFQQNNFIEMPLVFKQLNPQLYPQDSFVNALQIYPIPMWHWIFPLFKLSSAYNVLWVLTFLLRFFVFWAAGKLALTLTNGNRFAEVAAWAVFAAGINPPVAEGTVYPYTFEHTGFSIGCLLLAAMFFFKRKPIGFALMVGCAGFLNLLYGLQALVYFGVMCLASKEYRSEFVSFLKWVPLAVVLMLPAFAMAIPNLSIPSLPGDQFALLNRINYPFHFFPSSWSVLQWTRLAIAVAGMSCLAKWSNLDRGTRIAFATSMLVLILFIALAYVGGDVMEMPLFISSQPARAADVWFAFASVAMAAYLGREVAKAGTIGRAIVPLGGLFITIAFWRYGYESDTSTGLVLASIGVVFIIVGLAVRMRKTKTVPALASLGALLLVFALESALNIPRMQSQDGSFQLVESPYGNQMPLYNWIIGNTSKDSRFLIFPLAEDFRAITQRTPFFTFNEGNAMMWDQTFGPEWESKLGAFGVSATLDNAYPVYTQRVENAYQQSVNDSMAKQLSKSADLDYAVYGSDWQTALPVLYDDGRYKVVKLR